MITQQDLNKILEYIKRLSVKDTDFPTISEDLTGKEYISIIKNNKNTNLTLDSLIYKIKEEIITKETGSLEDKTMSQKAITDALVGKKLPRGAIDFSEGNAYSVGDNTVVFGKNNIAYPKYSIIAGSDNKLSSEAIGSAVFGHGNLINPTEEGSSTRCTFIAGNNNSTYNESETAVGKYNISTKGKTIFSIGNGTSFSDKKNAIEVYNDGNMYIKGIGGYNGSNSNRFNSLQYYLETLDSRVKDLESRSRGVQ